MATEHNSQSSEIVRRYMRYAGADKEINNFDVTMSKITALRESAEINMRWTDRTNQVGSKSLPDNFINDIPVSNIVIGGQSKDDNKIGTSTMAKLKSSGKKLFNETGKSQSRVFDEWLHKNLNMVGLMGDSDKSSIAKVHDYFDRYYSVYPDTELTNVYHYIFMTRPDCYLIDTSNGKLREEVKRNGLIENAYMTRPHVIRNLITDGYTQKNHRMYIPGKHRFMPMVTSRCESLQLANTQLQTSSLRQPYTLYTQYYGLHVAGSTGIDFSMTFREFGDLSIHYLMSVWMNYINDVMKGIYNPKSQYIRENRADYMVSIYDMMTGPDGRSLLYWVKLTGAFPTDNDNASLSFNLHGSQDNKVTIPFVAFRIEPIHPYSLIDFNFNAGFTNHDRERDINECSPFYSKIVNKSKASIVTTSDNPWDHTYSSGYGLHSRPFVWWNKRTQMFELAWEA